MSLPTAWVERIFTKMTLIYGRDFIGRWEGLDIADVKTDWAHELAGFQNWPEAIAWAFEHLPLTKPPTAIEFKSICYKAPRPERPALPEPKANPERLAAELKKLEPIKQAKKATDQKDWARAIIGRHEAGEKVKPLNLKFAKEALG